MKKKIVISAGGTGGHLFPALALANALRCAHGPDLLFVGGGLESNRYFDRKNFPFQQVACGSFVSKKPWDIVFNGWSLALGVTQSYRLMRRFQPDLVVGFGSFYSFPPLAAARALGIPIILYESNAIPGRVVRLMASHAVTTGVHFDETHAKLNGKAVTVGIPLREEVKKDKVSATTARQYFGLDETKTTLLIFGGSQGAEALNTLMTQALSVMTNGPFQVIHFTGRETHVPTMRQAYASHGIPCYVSAFESRMGMAWSAADLALTRSGAGTIAEARFFAVPTVMVPYPFATDAHQDHNADVLVSLGGGQKLTQSSLTPTRLASVLSELLSDKQEARTAMHQAILRSQQNRPEVSLLDLVWQTLNPM